MVYKVLVLDNMDYEDGSHSLTLLTGSVEEGAVYAEFHGSEEPDVIELAVSVDKMIEMRDYLTNLINKIAQKKNPYPKSLEDYYGNTYEVAEGE